MQDRALTDLDAFPLVGCQEPHHLLLVEHPRQHEAREHGPVLPRPELAGEGLDERTRVVGHCGTFLGHLLQQDNVGLRRNLRPRLPELLRGEFGVRRREAHLGGGHHGGGALAGLRQKLVVLLGRSGVNSSTLAGLDKSRDRTRTNRIP